MKVSLNVDALAKYIKLRMSGIYYRASLYYRRVLTALFRYLKICKELQIAGAVVTFSDM